ncbi:hypothetical protein Si034_00815 [Streptococcus infantarius subsp. infantarius]|nr:hypothetical protein [Streptococcus infantarius subsp. infantarius]MCO4637889.1 hypothetical protein [Streptococcus infantarius subsp. infantarius]MCO4642646.1 hypothetical protein [Streptococcus infantarius subsp. infantarius]MCO4644611.1 hypothetical protein [Streptococcus infantarius subsp. infantarius]MCO4651834.1 hypothetical protein [Streptococcus infantarius subsp. infantarius]
MKISTIGLTTAAVALFCVLAAPSVHADAVQDQAKDTQTQVTIIDSPPQDVANLKLIDVPKLYNFKIKLQANGAYSLDGDVDEKDANITVFNDKSTQNWSVKASIEEYTLSTESGKTATVTNFKINQQDLMGEHANQIVHKSEENKTNDNNTGNLSKKVTKEGLSVSFTNEKRDLKAGDILTGKVHYQLFNTPDAK